VTKTYRQAQILKLIRTQPIRTQEELSAALGKMGFEVTQVTLSRDIRELGLVKGSQGYQEAAPTAAPAGEHSNALRRVVEETVRDVRTAQNLVIIRTSAGNSAPLAYALDREGWPEIVGTIAGEDTVFVAAPDARQAQRIREKLLALVR